MMSEEKKKINELERMHQSEILVKFIEEEKAKERAKKELYA